MDRGLSVAAHVAPWQAAVEHLAPQLPAATLHGLREALAALACGQEAVPAEVPAPAAATELDGWLRRSARPQGFNDVRRRREALLRLGTWRALDALQHAHGDAPGALDALQAWMGRPEVDVPPGLAPALGYAGSAAALRFFDRDLRAALQRLAQRHDGAGAAFAPFAQAPPYEPSAAAAQGWSRAWSAAVAAVYLDWLRQGAQGRLDRAQQGLWRDSAVRFRAPSGLVVLPTRERSMHIDLWTDLVLAQALDHSAARWPRAGERWHRVPVAMHDLGERDRGGRASGGVRTLFRGLGVEMLYQAVFAGRAEAAMAGRRAPEPAAAAAPAAVLVVDVPTPRPGQQANLELVLRWHEPPGGTRRVGSAPAPRLDDVQRRVLDDWRHRRDGGEAPAAGLDAARVDWRAAGAADAFEADDGRALVALGHAALWRAAGAEADWLDVALVVRHAGRWAEVPLLLHDDAVDGELRTWLLVDAAALPCGADALRQALAGPACWVARRAGVGVFVMAGVAPDAAPGDAGR